MADKNNTPKKKKTMVSLPGSLRNLVRDVQTGEAQSAPQPAPAPQPEKQPEPAAPKQSEPAETAAQEAPKAAQPKAAEPEQPKKQTEKKADGVGEGSARTVTRESTADSWGLFLDLAREYKEKDSHLSTIYIDRDLKNVLDRLRASRDVKMPTTAILSAIVARFIFDHEQRIKDAIYGDRLI